MMKYPRENEDQEMIAFFDLVRWHYPEYHYKIFHVANERKTTFMYGKRLKRCGVVAGVLDIYCLIPRGKYHGLAIEMKVKSNKPTPNQKNVIESLKEEGYKVAVCYGAEEAFICLNEYLNL